MDDTKKQNIENFKECRKTFFYSLNSITLLSVLIFLNTIIPYTTYVGNILALRLKDSQNELNFQEKIGKFDLVKLEEEWIKKHSASDKQNLDGKQKIKGPVGDIEFRKPELTLLYPLVVTILMVYLFLHRFRLKELQTEVAEELFTRLPKYRIYLSWLLLYTCLFISIFILILPPQVPNDFKGLPRLGQIINQESSYQLNPNLDLILVGTSFLVSVFLPIIYFAKQPSGASKNN